MRRYIARKSRGEENDFMLAMARGDDAIRTSSAGLIYRPGGTSAGNVVATWAEVQAAIAAANGALRVYIDSSLQNPAPVPTASGTTNCFGAVEFWAYNNSGDGEELRIQSGATLSRPRGFYGNLEVSMVGTVAPPLAFTDGSVLIIDGAPAGAPSSKANLILQLLAGATEPMIDLSGGAASLVLQGREAVLQNDAAGALVALGTVSTLSLWGGRSLLYTLTGPIVSGAAGSTFRFVAQDPSAAYPNPIATALAGFTGTQSAPVNQYATPPTFVFQPGGTAAPGVYLTWTDLMQAVNAVAGPKTIFVDDTLAAAHATAGGPYNIDQCTFQPNFLGNGTLIWDTGATVAPPESVWLQGGIIFQSQNTTDPICTYTAGTFGAWYVAGDTTTIESNAGAMPFFKDSVSGLAIFAHDTTSLGDGTHNMMTTDAGQASTLFGFDLCNIKAHACGGLGTVNVSQVASCTVSFTQDVSTFTVNTNPPVNSVQQTGNAGSASHTVTTTTGNIQRKMSGKVLVMGAMAGATAAADTITATLVRDVATANTTIATQTVTTTAGQLNYNVSFAFLDTLPDNLTHTYSIRLAGAQNNTVGANQGIITGIEQP